MRASLVTVTDEQRVSACVVVTTNRFLKDNEDEPCRM